MSTDEIKLKLKEEGFKFVYEWKDTPNFIYKPHAHKDKVKLYIVSGSLTFRIKGTEYKLKSGDNYDVPPETLHTALVGSKGCEYIVGEMIEGDS